MIIYIRAAWLPKGWAYSPYHAHHKNPDLFVLERPGGGMVTLDFTRRIWNGGMGTPRALPKGEERSYFGRHWKKAMVDDAVAWLERTMT